MSQAAPASIPTPGTIEPATLYRLDEIKARSGLGAYALRMLRRSAGLRVLRFGGRAFVLGSDFISAITRADGSEGASE